MQHKCTWKSKLALPTKLRRNDLITFNTIQTLISCCDFFTDRVHDMKERPHRRMTTESWITVSAISKSLSINTNHNLHTGNSKETTLI